LSATGLLQRDLELMGEALMKWGHCIVKQVIYLICMDLHFFLVEIPRLVCFFLLPVFDDIQCWNVWSRNISTESRIMLCFVESIFDSRVYLIISRFFVLSLLVHLGMLNVWIPWSDPQQSVSCFIIVSLHFQLMKLAKELVWTDVKLVMVNPIWLSYYYVIWVK
jgi:hypothetical protein